MSFQPDLRAFSGGPSSSRLDAVDRIEYCQGPTLSALYGANAFLAATINAITREPAVGTHVDARGSAISTNASELWLRGFGGNLRDPTGVTTLAGPAPGLHEDNVDRSGLEHPANVPRAEPDVDAVRALLRGAQPARHRRPGAGLSSSSRLRAQRLGHITVDAGIPAHRLVGGVRPELDAHAPEPRVPDEQLGLGPRREEALGANDDDGEPGGQHGHADGGRSPYLTDNPRQRARLPLRAIGPPRLPRPPPTRSAGFPPGSASTPTREPGHLLLHGDVRRPPGQHAGREPSHLIPRHQ